MSLADGESSAPKWVWWVVGGIMVVLALVLVFRSSQPAKPVPAHEPLQNVSQADDVALTRYSQHVNNQWETVMALLNAQSSGAAGGTSTPPTASPGGGGGLGPLQGVMPPGVTGPV